jgi:hypothetical protein
LPKETGYWGRQFQPAPHIWDRIFDLVMGGLLPISCLIYDSVMFHSFLIGQGLLQAWKPAALIFIGGEIAVLVLWLALGSWQRRLSAVTAGILLSGALGALCLGLFLLPFSLLALFVFAGFGCMIVFIGLLGLTPFPTSFVFLRNGVRALRQARQSLDGLRVARLTILGILLAVMAPLIVQLGTDAIVDRSITGILSEDPARRASAVGCLRWIKSIANLDRIVWVYEKEPDHGKKSLLSLAYMEVTGEPIESRFGRMD